MEHFVSQSLSTNGHLLRNLAIYPQCAVIQEDLKRFECCDIYVQSQAGRDFCYSDIIHEQDAFAKCDFDTYAKMFDCCEELANGDLDLKFDCRTSLPGGGICRPEMIPCHQNYQNGLAIVSAEKFKVEQELQKKEETEQKSAAAEAAS